MARKILLFFYLICLILFVCFCVDNNKPTEPDTNSIATENPIVNLVSIDSLTRFLNEFTGETSVIIEGKADTIFSRRYDHEDNKLAAKYLTEKMKSYDLNVKSQTYFREKVNFKLTEGENIIAIQNGMIQDQYYLICAHYDSWADDSTYAPGAEDNASGCVAILEAARILSMFQTRYSIIYAFFDQEEAGYQGSRIYADSIIGTGIDLKGVIELDMIGYDGNNDLRYNLFYANEDSKSSLVNKIDSINIADSSGFSFKLVEDRSLADSYPFKKAGYETIGFTENAGLSADDQDKDVTPYYHTIDDRVSSLNMESYGKLIKLIIKLLAVTAVAQ